MNAAVVQAVPRLIEATAPPERRGIARDEVRLLVTNRAERSQTHASFLDLPSFLRKGDVVVVNDSMTLPAALPAQRQNGRWLQVHVSTKYDERLFTAEPRGAVTAGEELRLPGGASAVVIAPVDPEHPRIWYTWFQLPQPMNEYLNHVGEPIRYGYVTQRFPLSDYQTLFAREPGSAEMPSAARPFTPRVVNALRDRGVDIATVTLHCGVASFEAPERPPTERYAVPHTTAGLVNAARRQGRRIIAVGSTVLRALESSVQGGEVVASTGWTDVVVDEKYHVRVADGLLTGFHDASATHLWMLRAFLDRELFDESYAQAAANGYHYHEFGDVQLIL